MARKYEWIITCDLPMVNLYQVDETIAKRLVEQCIYAEQGKSGAATPRSGSSIGCSCGR